ncbi:hypothetical protein B0H11DRAFT_223066 [Mycena galericulata]|nr:hypothetical protein B0H11DRAFT_223066 [Mycena galericulata]
MLRASVPGVLPGGMSASDAKESIGRGGSLKERMAALQGRGAFGGAAPAPAPPVGTGKKWVPPPKPERVEEDVAVVAVPDREDGEANKAQGETEDKQEEQAEEGEKDPEEEERQRRAAIAARMARLGGARVGMSPPVFGPKPTIKKRPSEDAASVKSTGSEGTPASPPTSPPIPAASLGRCLCAFFIARGMEYAIFPCFPSRNSQNLMFFSLCSVPAAHETHLR